MKKKDIPYLFISADGTRMKKNYIRSGFYHIANDLELPICFIYKCHKKKQFGWKYFPANSLSKTEVIDEMRQYYAGVQPKIVKNMSEIQFKKEGQIN